MDLGLVDLDQEDKVDLMDKEAALQVLEHCQSLSLPLDVQVYTTEGIFYATPLETADPGFLRIHQPTRFVPMEELLGKDWMKVVLLEREKDGVHLKAEADPGITLTIDRRPLDGEG